MTYEHYVYTNEPECLAAAYQQAGFITEAEERSEGLVMVYTDYSEESLEKVRRIALDHGADYDGGGMYIGPAEALS